LFAGLLTKDISKWLKLFGWTRCGEIVSLVIGALAGTEFFPRELMDKILKMDLLAGKFSRALDEILGIFTGFVKNIAPALIHCLLVDKYEVMDLPGKMSCHCLVLLQCTNKFRAEGSILHCKEKVA